MKKIHKRTLPLFLIAAGLAAFGVSACEKKREGVKADIAATAGLSSEALVARAAPQVGAPLFTRLEPFETGIEFSNYLKPENVRRYMENGQGIAVGDYDGDGYPDLYLVSADRPNRLYRQIAPWKFEDVTEQAGVDGGEALGAGASFADIDNDGDLDLFVANMNAKDLLYRNNGDGTFTGIGEQAGVATDSVTEMGAFADYDRDGDLDLYLVTYRLLTIEEESPQAKLRKINGEITVHPDFVEQYGIIDGELVEAGHRDWLFQNNGDGTFTDVTQRAGISGYELGLSASWWDFDQDGWPDLYVANDFKWPDHLYHNNGDGTFTDVLAERVPHSSWFSMGSDSGDLNNDGLPDFIVADMSNTTHFKQKLMMGAMGSNAKFLESAVPRQYMRNAVYLNSGGKRFWEAAFLTDLDSTDWTWSILIADYDNDGWSDVFVTNGMERNLNHSDWAKEADRLKAAGEKEALKEHLAHPPRLAETNLALRNSGDLHFEQVSKAWGVDLTGVSQGAVYTDLDRDGDLDLIVNSLNAPIAVYRNDGHEGNAAVFAFHGTRSNRFGVGVKLWAQAGGKTLYRELNLAHGYLSATEPVLHLGLGNATSIDSVRVVWPSGSEQRFENLTAGQFYTITEPAQGSTVAAKQPAPDAQFEEIAGDRGVIYRQREHLYDDYARQSLLPWRHSQLGPGLAWGDADGDGDDDLFIGGAAGEPATLLLRQADGRFATGAKGPWFADAVSEDLGALWLDADGDGDQDLVVTSGSVETEPGADALRDRLYLNLGAGKFERAPKTAFPAPAESTAAIAAADFDRDGDLDVVIGGRVIPGQYPGSPPVRLFENENGRFSDVTKKKAPGLLELHLTSALLWSDADGDGWLDLLVAGEWGPVRLFRNERGLLRDATGESGLLDKAGWWNSLAAGDFDRDGDIDYLALGMGLNTKYHASAEHPVHLYAKDFDGNGQLDIVEAEYEGETEYPVRGRSCSSRAMPFIKDKFHNYEAYALASLSEIYTPKALQTAKALEVTELSSLLLRNDGTGHFTAEPLPRLAQIAPTFGASVVDANGDGNPDVYLLQNFFGPQVETGRWDGGQSLLLAGDGSGGFSPIGPASSGLIVSEDGTALASTDFDGDGWADFVAATNEGPLRFFRNRGSGKGRPLTVRLRGHEGNSGAAGARVTLTTNDGKTQTAEAYAGSGYLSQQGPELYFGVPSGTTATKMTVRWPDGSTSEVGEGLEQNRITVTQP